MPPLRVAVRDFAASLLFGSGLTRPALASARKLTIATFHRVLPPERLAEYPSPEIAVTPDELDWFLEFFCSHFTCGTLHDTLDRYLAGGRQDRPLLAITFDDGQRDNHLHARPVLAAHGVRATFFVVARAAERNEPLWHDRLGFALRVALEKSPDKARQLLARLGVAEGAAVAETVGTAIQRTKALSPDQIDDTVARAAAGGSAVPPWDGLMGWPELRALTTDGHEIGSHSLTHPILPSCDDVALKDETARSRSMISGELRVPVDSFCYPNGDHDDRVVAAVEEAGYRCAVTTRWGRNDRSSSLFRLRRCDIQGATARSGAGELSPARLAWRMSGLHPGLG
jgi:peptidoglycan/xylan/chitin deacetylase (PgdA/CDA1 family)